MRYVLALVVLLTSASAASQGTEIVTIPCSKGTDLTEALEKYHQESLRGSGMTSQGGYIMFYQTKTGSTFSVVVLKTSGQACLITSGEEWIWIEPLLGEKL